MDYQNTLKYLYESLPMFQHIGGKAYKPGLETTFRLDEYFGHPHRQFKTIHIGGTNGKGSCSHTIAAVLQSAGYRVGLFTSPHLIDFRERIRVDGQMIPEGYVIDFVENHRSFFEPLHPSFFELTTAMAFRYFADRKVDVAVVEVGMGGRLDCTNIIHPDICVITNIGFDHMQYLGNSLSRIAREKAGIIKEGIPVVIGRAAGPVKRVFTLKAKEKKAPIFYAENFKNQYEMGWESNSDAKPQAEEAGQEGIVLKDHRFGSAFRFELGGDYQMENMLTIALTLRKLEEVGYVVGEKDYATGFSQVSELTGLMGRWQKLQSHPDLICDTGHNADGIRYVSNQLQTIRKKFHKEIHIVFGMVNDKDISSVLPLLPKDATYYFTKATVKRALPQDELMKLATEAGLKGTSYPTVVEAVKSAKEKCLPKDMIFVGGSSFIVADLLANRDALDLH